MIGIALLSIFFLFGALMCLLTVIALIFPGGLLDPLWRLNLLCDYRLSRQFSLSKWTRLVHFIFAPKKFSSRTNALPGRNLR